MTSVDTRQLTRNSFFMFADVEHEGTVHRLKVRNLSPGGMMAEGGKLAVTRGERLQVELRNVGKVDAVVAWVEGTRFGVAFAEEIDAEAARKPKPEGMDPNAPLVSRPAASAYGHADPSRLRKL